MFYSATLFCCLVYAHRITLKIQLWEIIFNLLAHGTYIFALMTDINWFEWITVIFHLTAPFTIIKLKGKDAFRDIWNFIYLTLCMFISLRRIYTDISDSFLEVVFTIMHVFHFLKLFYESIRLITISKGEGYLYLRFVKLIHKVQRKLKADDICIICQN
jgi:hypothetical protein